MKAQKVVRDLIIGKDRYIESYGEFKQVMLSGQFALLGVFICWFYGVLSIIDQQWIVLPVFLIGIMFLALSIFHHRQGRHRAANNVLLPTINLIVYLFASSESPNTGTFVFFIAISMATFALFNYQKRIVSIFFVVGTYVLFILAYFIDFSILPKRVYSDDMLLFNVVVNFTLALPATAMGVYLLISLNHYNAEQLVKSNEQLKKTNTELDRFVYSTSHDLRAPLTSLLGLINIAERSGNESEQERYFSMMKDRVNSLDKFIKDITDYSRNNRLQVNYEKVSLKDITLEAWDNLKFTPGAERIKFEASFPSDVMIESDKNRLNIVLSNLLSNAIRYHDNRKEEQYIKVASQVNGRIIYLQVQDNGQGISPEYHKRVFDMFYRANEQSKGSGLGLYIVKESLVKLSGSIQLDSYPGVGSTFTVKLPNRS